MKKQELLNLIKDKASELGIDLVDISRFKKPELLDHFTDEVKTTDGFLLNVEKIKKFDKDHITHYFLTTIPEHPELLLDAPETVRRNTFVLKDLLTRNIDYIDYIDKDIKSDREFVLRVVELVKNGTDRDVKFDLYKLVKWNKEFLSDRELVTEIAKLSTCVCKYANKDLLDRKFFDEVVEEKPMAILYANAELRDNDTLMAKAIEKDPGTISFVSDRLKDDKAFAMLALWHSSFEAEVICSVLSERLQNDPDIIKLTARRMEGDR